jgi:signal transduction histidine kinase
LFNYLELNGRKKNSVEFPILINVSKIETHNQPGWVVFIKDLTLKKKIEQELTYAKKSVLEAVEANNAKSQFVANMSHELRTPLNSIIGFSQLLQTDTQSPLIPEHAEYVSYINQAGTHLLSLINEILDLAKLESGQLNLSLEIVNISAVIKEALILIYTLASKKHIKISSVFDTMPDYYIVVDRIRIKQVLLNLLSNAVKYNNTNGSIRIDSEIIDNQHLKISITDTGRGISTHKISHLFDPFNRLGAENSDIEGTGIGLTITKSLVEDMSGKIGVLSEENKGSTFWVEFPLAENQKIALKSNPEGVILPCQLPDNCHIVYIEDNQSNTQLINSFMRRIPNVNLHVAADGKSGLELIAKIKPSIILMDIDLPDLNGFEMLLIISS